MMHSRGIATFAKLTTERNKLDPRDREQQRHSSHISFHSFDFRTGPFCCISNRRGAWIAGYRGVGVFDRLGEAVYSYRIPLLFSDIFSSFLFFRGRQYLGGASALMKNTWCLYEMG